jgi:hypothetical protein
VSRFAIRVGGGRKGPLPNYLSKCQNETTTTDAAACAVRRCPAQLIELAKQFSGAEPALRKALEILL